MDQKRTIPAISIRQPWAELILRGEKTIEIRNWTHMYRGDLYLHTGKMADGYKHIEYGMPDVFRGGYVGIVELAAIVPFTQENWRLWHDKHLSKGPYKPGLYAWILRHPRRLTRPVPGPGMERIFQPEPDMRKLLEESSRQE